MKKYMKYLMISLALVIASVSGYHVLPHHAKPHSTVVSVPDLGVIPVTPLPAVIVENTTLSNIVYKVHNYSQTDTFPITLTYLNGDGMSYTSTCANLAPNSECNINMTLVVRALPASTPSEPYIKTFFVNGAPRAYPYTVASKIIPNSGDVTADANITLSDSATTTDTFTLTLTPTAGGDPYTFNSVPFGKSALSPDIPAGNYTAHIAPNSISVSSHAYDAPLDSEFHLAQSGDTKNFVYTKEQNISVTTNITAPNIGENTVSVTAVGPTSYGPKNQTGGSDSFFMMYPGSYTVSSTGYPGTDELVYTCKPSNPYTISAESTVIAFSCTAQPPSTRSVSTVITAPNLPSGSVVAITLEDEAHTYGPHNQTAGTDFFADMADASDYTLTCANYSVGSDVYACTPASSYTVDSSHTTISVVYSKKAPPGTNFDWHSDHLTTIKNANIHAIYLGGGSTTAPVWIGTNPLVNDFLNSSIATYEGATVPILSTAHVQNFPDYIAMGTVSAVTTGVTDQLKAQQLDMDNHYEGNGDGNAGCAWDNAQGIQAPMTQGTGSIGSVPAGTYNVFTDYYAYGVGVQLSITAPNLPTVSGQFGKVNIKMVGSLETSTQNVTVVPMASAQFDILMPGNYTLTPASYTGTDGHTYNATVSNPIDVHYGMSAVSIVYTDGGSTIAPSPTTPRQPGQWYYDGTITSITNPSTNNYVVNVTFNLVPQHSNPNLALIKQFTFPSTATVTFNNTAPHLDLTVAGHVNLNIQSDGLCNSIWYDWGGYTPQINDIAAQAAEVQTATGHQLIAGSVMYTTRNSDSFDAMTDDVTNDYSIVFYLYNLMYEGKLMQAQYPTVKMVLLLNPDSTNAFQNCTQPYCPFIWKTGLTQDTVNKLIAIPNLQADYTKAIDRMVAKGYMTSGAAAALKVTIGTSQILVPPVSSGRTYPGVPELYLLQNLLFKNIAPNVPFGYGQNIYDNSNPLMAVGTPPVVGAPWETGSVGWLHKVNHLGYSSGTVTAAINFEGDKYAQFLKDLNYVSYTGDTFAQYKPDFVYSDIYERDPMPSAVGSGFLMNGVDLDTYFLYWTRIENDINMVTPLAIWQIPGASFQVQGTTLPNALSGTWPDYIFGHPAINNDMSNLDTSLNYSTTDFVGYLNSVYFTSNASVKNAEDYVKLTAAAP